MARPPKDADERMTETIRIPVTPEQKRQIVEAARANPSGVAAWARELLLKTAKNAAKR
jgi:hypothetical protein